MMQEHMGEINMELKRQTEAAVLHRDQYEINSDNHT